jgi:hypothetical protein
MSKRLKKSNASRQINGGKELNKKIGTGNDGETVSQQMNRKINKNKINKRLVSCFIETQRVPTLTFNCCMAQPP